MDNTIEDLRYPEYSEHSECDERPMSVCSGLDNDKYDQYNDWFECSSDSMDSEASLQLPREGNEQRLCIDELIMLAVDFYQSKSNLEEHKLAYHEDTSERRIQQISSELQYAYNTSYFRYIEYYCAYDRLFINVLFSDAEVREEGMRLINDVPSGCDVDAFIAYTRAFFYVTESLPEVARAEVARENAFCTPPPREPSPHTKQSMFNSPSSVVTLLQEDGFNDDLHINNLKSNGA